MSPDRSFKAYVAQSPLFDTLKANRRLWKVNLCLAVAGLVVAAGAACADSTTADAPIDTPVYYRTCADAPGPLHAGDPGYRSGLDRDGDGVACDNATPARSVPTDAEILSVAAEDDLLFDFCLALYENDDAGVSRLDARFAFVDGYERTADDAIVSGGRVFDVMEQFCDDAAEEVGS